jgi:hypothetical protein
MKFDYEKFTAIDKQYFSNNPGVERYERDCTPDELEAFKANNLCKGVTRLIAVNGTKITHIPLFPNYQ